MSLLDSNNNIELLLNEQEKFRITNSNSQFH